jgi:acid phosphatase (class A)
VTNGRRNPISALVLCCLLLGALPAAAQSGVTVSRPPEESGYLTPAQRPDHRRFLPPPPADDSVLGGADMDLYRATRSLEGQPRWQLAARDADIAQGDLLRDFACSVGIDLGTAEAPATRKVLTRASADLFPLVGASKDFYKRPRPYLVENRPLCIVPTEDLTRGGSYPSGHSAAGWLYALLLAETVPEHASAILARGRAYGESRVVCGVHYLSDIEGGRTLATALAAVLAASDEFAGDILAARREVAALRDPSLAPAEETCAAEPAALKTPW